MFYLLPPNSKFQFYRQRVYTVRGARKLRAYAQTPIPAVTAVHRHHRTGCARNECYKNIYFLKCVRNRRFTRRPPTQLSSNPCARLVIIFIIFTYVSVKPGFESLFLHDDFLRDSKLVSPTFWHLTISFFNGHNSQKNITDDDYLVRNHDDYGISGLKIMGVIGN